MFGRSKAAKVKKQAALAEAVKKTEAPAVVVQPGIDPAVIAAIMAAVAASMSTSANGILIKSIRRSKPTLPVWGFTGKIEQVTNRY